MPIIIFKYPNKGIHTGRMRNVSGRKMKLLPAAARAGPVPGLGDICSKLFTPWQTALHIYYGAVVQLPPRIMEVLPIPPPPIGKKRGTKHESKMKSKTTAKTTGLQMIFDGFDGCSMRCFLLLLFASFRFSFVVCVSNVERKNAIEAKEKRKPLARNKTYFLLVVLCSFGPRPFCLPSLSHSLSYFLWLALSFSLANALHNSWHANFSIEHKRNKAKRPQCHTTRRVSCPGNGRKSVEAVATLPPIPAASPPPTQSNPLKLCSIFLHACASRFFFRPAYPAN